MSTVSLNNGYFSSMFKIVHENGIELRKPRKIYSEHRQIVDSWPGKIDTAANILRRKGIISVDLTFKGEDADSQFARLQRHQSYFDGIVGCKLDWRRNLPNERQIVATLKADPKVKKDWPNQHAWIAARLIGFRIAFRSTISK